MASKSSAVHQAVAEIRAKAKELRSYGAEGPALALEPRTLIPAPRDTAVIPPGDPTVAAD